MSTSVAGTPHYYARVPSRLRASLIDGAIYATSPALLLLASSFTDGSPEAARTLVIGWMVSALLYEPFLVSVRGATIGHRAANIRIVDARTGGNPPFWRAFIRFIVKSVLGIFSFALVTTTVRHQAAHDLVAGTTVEINELWRVRPGSYLQDRVVDPRAVPASWPRRIAVTLGYSAAWLTLVLLAFAMLRSAGGLLFFVGLSGQVMCLTLGLGGRLPGAQPAVPPAAPQI